MALYKIFYDFFYEMVCVLGNYVVSLWQNHTNNIEYDRRKRDFICG